jgi:hypothetical protein
MTGDSIRQVEKNLSGLTQSVAKLEAERDALEREIGNLKSARNEERNVLMLAETSGLARMNMILHDNPTALIMQGNTLSDPKFLDGDVLKTFDYVVANPPFSDKRWSTGIDPLHDSHDRFESFGVPPGKQGDYAYPSGIRIGVTDAPLTVHNVFELATSRFSDNLWACVLRSNIYPRLKVRKHCSREGLVFAHLSEQDPLRVTLARAGL